MSILQSDQEKYPSNPLEEVFVSGNLPWEYDTKVLELIHKSGEEGPDQDGNHFSRYRVVMDDGTKLNLNTCEPRKRVTNIPVLGTPSWFTGSRGFNEHTQTALGNIGFPSMLVGHVGEERDTWIREAARIAFHPNRVIREMRQIHIARQAHNMIEVHKLADQFWLDAERAFLYGDSRGAMTALGVTALQEKAGLSIPFALGVAPCFNHRMDLETFLKAGIQLGKEGLSVGRMTLRGLENARKVSVNTVNPSPKSLLYEAAHTPTLFRGDAGKFVDYIPRDQSMVLFVFSGDLAGQSADWQKGFESHPNVYIHHLPGTHADFIRKGNRELALRPFLMIGQQLAEGVKPEELDFSQVRRPLVSV